MDPAPHPKIYEMLMEFYEENYVGERRRIRMNRYIDMLRKVLVFLMIIHAFCQFTPILYSLLNLVFRGIVYPLPIFLPFFERFSPTGLFIDCCFRIFLNLGLYSTNPVIDTMYFLFTTHKKISVDVFECQIEEYTADLETIEKYSDDIKKEVEVKLIKMIDFHWEITTFHE